jgi:quinol monooxygenase YgiN
MHVQIVEFEVRGVSRREYEALCEELAPAFARIPGLVAKLWIVDPESNRAGGVYTWVDKAACEAYKADELYRAAIENPALTNLRSRQFDVVEAATQATSGQLLAASA